jgi:hypothetical protein
MFDPENLRLFLYYAGERDLVQKRRATGEPPPWTDDPILAGYRFCHNRREDDATTKWIAAHWRDPFADDPDVWHAMAVARLVNWTPTLEELGGPLLPFDEVAFADMLRMRAARGEQVWGSAYVIPAGPAGVAKHDFIAVTLGDMWNARERLRPRAGETLQTFHTRLMSVRGLASFLAAQIVADAKFTALLTAAPDWSTFAASGPGSRQGLNRLLGRDAKAPWAEGVWRATHARLRTTIMPDLQKLGLGDLSASDTQNLLCEFFKYEQAARGGRMPKTKFRSANSGVSRKIRAGRIPANV